MINMASTNPGILIRLSSKTKETLLKERDFPRFCPITAVGKIRADLIWEDRILITPKTLLLFVEPLDFSKETAAVSPTTLVEPLVIPAISETSAAHATTWRKARKEFNMTGKILGRTFLTPNCQLIWISHYDLEHFEEVAISR